MRRTDIFRVLVCISVCASLMGCEQDYGIKVSGGASSQTGSSTDSGRNKGPNSDKVSPSPNPAVEPTNPVVKPTSAVTAKPTNPVVVASPTEPVETSTPIAEESSQPVPTSVPTVVPTGDSGHGSNTCQIKTLSKPVRILVMVDNSGSTAATDPNKKHRVQTVHKFLSDYGSKQNITYSYGEFHLHASSYDMSLGQFVADPRAPFGDAAGEKAALKKFQHSKSAGHTSYKEAFNLLRKLMSDDLRSTDTESYVIIFMSDGQPTDLGGTAASELAGITAGVKDLLDTVPKGRLTISTVFFGDNRDRRSVRNLSTMADLGNGQFVNSNTAATISIDHIINVPVEACGPEHN